MAWTKMAARDETMAWEETAVREETAARDETAARYVTAARYETAARDMTAARDDTAARDEAAWDETAWDETAARDETTVRDETAARDETAVRNVKGSGEGILRLLQVNCRSIRSKIVEFETLIDTHRPDVIIGTESWLTEEINNAEIFSPSFITYRRDRKDKIGGGIFICVRKNIISFEIFSDDVLRF